MRRKCNPVSLASSYSELLLHGDLGRAARFTDNSVERMHTYVLKHDDGNTGCVSSVLVCLRLAFEPFEFRLSLVTGRHQEKKKEQEKKRKRGK